MQLHLEYDNQFRILQYMKYSAVLKWDQGMANEMAGDMQFLIDEQRLRELCCSAPRDGQRLEQVTQSRPCLEMGLT